MTDIVSRDKRSAMMSMIRGKNTKPEMTVRSLLHRAGFRFRLHVGYLPGRPDIVLPRHKAVLEVRGCFWHGHACHLFRLPATRKEFWKEKIETNVSRDKRNSDLLMQAGWRLMIIWECSLKQGLAPGFVESLTDWILSGQQHAELEHDGFKTL